MKLTVMLLADDKENYMKYVTFPQLQLAARFSNNNFSPFSLKTQFFEKGINTNK